MVLIADILMRGLPAFWSYSVVLDVPVKAEEIDPDNKRAELAQQAQEPRAERRSWLGRWLLGPNDADRAPDPLQPIRAGDYFGLARQALYDAFPGVEGRQDRRKLQGLLSTGAGRSAARPGGRRHRPHRQDGATRSAVGQRRPLHEGRGHRLRAAGRARRGDAERHERRDHHPTSANDFADYLVRLKRGLSLRAKALRTEADRLERRAGAAQADRVKELRDEDAPAGRASIR